MPRRSGDPFAHGIRRRDAGQHPPPTRRSRTAAREEGATRHISQLTRQTLAIVLAGGRGERLRALTDWRAKPAVPFGGKFRIIDFTLSNCVNSGIRRIGIATQYKAQSLIRHVQRGWASMDGRMGEFVELLPAQQRIHSSWYLGTADAVFQNLDILRRYAPQYVVVLAGDHIYKMDYGSCSRSCHERADMTAAASSAGEGGRSLGVMALTERARFAESRRPAAIPGAGSALVNMGVYVFRDLYDS
jgi:glucose-1-phosphate adenylyltransferase